MNRKIKKLMERMVIKMLEEDLDQRDSVITSEDGKTIVSMPQHSMITLLMYLQLTSEEKGAALQGSDLSEELDLDVEFEDEEQYTEEEVEQVLDRILELKEKNKQFREEMAALLE